MAIVISFYESCAQDGWRSDPWQLSSENEFLYGRGVTDDKGPILATLFAVKELLVHLCALNQFLLNCAGCKAAQGQHCVRL